MHLARDKRLRGHKVYEHYEGRNSSRMWANLSLILNQPCFVGDVSPALRNICLAGEFVVFYVYSGNEPR